MSTMGKLLRKLAPVNAPLHPAGRTHLEFEGVRKAQGDQAKNRIIIAIACFGLIYAVIGGRLVQYGMRAPETVSSIGRASQLMASRPDLLDRNGEVLATDIRTVSLFAEPHKIVDADEAVELLATVLPDLDLKGIHRKLSSNSRFQWLRRQLTPKQQSQILALGIPGVGFRPETRRFYPGGPTASHIVGHVNIDNVGIAGLEKYIDDNGLAALHQAGLTTPVIMLTTFDDHQLVMAALQAGAKGYLLKDVSLDILVTGIKDVAAGKTLIQPSITEKVLQGLQGLSTDFESFSEPEPLSEKEQEILRLMAAGCSNREIALAMHKSEGTVKNQVSTILAKMGVRDRTRAVLKAIENGII